MSWMKAVFTGIAALMIGNVSQAGETLSLDGTWEIVFDHNDVGRTESWH